MSRIYNSISLHFGVSIVLTQTSDYDGCLWMESTFFFSIDSKKKHTPSKLIKKKKKTKIESHLMESKLRFRFGGSTVQSFFQLNTFRYIISFGFFFRQKFFVYIKMQMKMQCSKKIFFEI